MGLYDAVEIMRLKGSVKHPDQSDSYRIYKSIVDPEYQDLETYIKVKDALINCEWKPVFKD